MASHPLIDRSQLFERLARGHGERVVVLTPNRRLSQALEAEFDRRQVAAGLPSWEAPDIVPYDTWLERCYEEAVYSPGGAELPALLTPAQEQVLWEDAVRASRWSVLSPAATAALAAEAWTLAHDWRLENALDVWPGNEDSEAFAAWRGHYRRRTERDHLLDAARLPALVAELIAESRIALPASLVLYAFDLQKPRQADFLDRCAAAGVEVLACASPRARGSVARIELESPRHELEQAARWARSRLEARPATRALEVLPAKP